MCTYKSLKANKTYSLLLLLFVSETGSLCTLGWSEVHSVDQAGLKLRDLPASAAFMPRSEVYTTLHGQ